MNQVKQQASKLQSSFDDKLKAQTDKQKAVTAFIAKPVLLRNGELHQDAWAPLLRDADEYTKSQRCVAGEDLAEWIVFHVEDLKADAHNKAGTPAAGARQQQWDRHQFPVF
ncbi:hypothetical protein WJX77_001660 [Trebouxia sp. C0004]